MTEIQKQRAQKHIGFDRETEETSRWDVRISEADSVSAIKSFIVIFLFSLFRPAHQELGLFYTEQLKISV